MAGTSSKTKPVNFRVTNEVYDIAERRARKRLLKQEPLLNSVPELLDTLVKSEVNLHAKERLIYDITRKHGRGEYDSISH